MRRKSLDVQNFFLFVVVLISLCALYLCYAVIRSRLGLDQIDPTWTDANINKTILDADSLVAALKLYRNQQNKFPKKLLELQPRYILKVPKPTAGTGFWEYDPAREDGFSIGFDSTVEPNCYRYELPGPAYRRYCGSTSY